MLSIINNIFRAGQRIAPSVFERVERALEGLERDARRAQLVPGKHYTLTASPAGTVIRMRKSPEESQESEKPTITINPFLSAHTEFLPFYAEKQSSFVHIKAGTVNFAFHEPRLQARLVKTEEHGLVAHKPVHHYWDGINAIDWLHLGKYGTPNGQRTQFFNVVLTGDAHGKNQFAVGSGDNSTSFSDGRIVMPFRSHCWLALVYSARVVYGTWGVDADSLPGKTYEVNSILEQNSQLKGLVNLMWIPRGDENLAAMQVFTAGEAPEDNKHYKYVFVPILVTGDDAIVQQFVRGNVAIDQFREQIYPDLT